MALKATSRCSLVPGGKLGGAILGLLFTFSSPCLKAEQLPQNLSAYSDGPNCFNSALVAVKILPHRRFSSSEEFKFYLNSELCRNLTDGEVRLPRDIGVVRSVLNEVSTEYHAFNLVTQDLAYSKNGQSRAAPYAVMPLLQVLAAYNVPAESKCRQNQAVDVNECIPTTSYFRCISLDEHLRKHPVRNERSLQALQSFKRLEAAIESAVMKNHLVDPEVLRAASSDLKALEDGGFLEASLRLRARSVNEQLRLLGLPDLLNTF
ncbi:MAG: hypothetical protein EOP06_22030 [Proteobacteria bacterium]|nr:MAG: hypothetical protein EOP06_22030 [Pseudomonadota bacterium]